MKATELMQFQDDLLAAPCMLYGCALQCPHRLVPLSEGRVNQQGELECGYHGW